MTERYINKLTYEVCMDNKTQKKKWDHPYISFDEAMEIANKIKEMGKPTADALAKALGDKNAGWFRFKVASVRRWGLADGWGDMGVTQAYKDIVNEKRVNQSQEVKRELFMNIPLFNEIYETYKENGLPQEPYFTNALADKYGLKGRNPNLIANIVRDFITKAIPSYGREEIQEPEKKSGSFSGNNTKSPVGAVLSDAPGEFPIQILTKEEHFNWDVKNEVDWNVVDSVINSIKERWKKNHS